MSEMKKNWTFIFVIMVVLFILSGTSYSFNKANVTAAIKKEFASGGNLLAIKAILLDVYDVKKGIMQKKILYNQYDRTTRVLQELPYEAKVKVNCVRRNDNKIMKTVTDEISGALTRNKMGRFEITGVDPSFICKEYNIGCVSGACENGLGVELFIDGEGNNEHYVLFMGTYKNGKKQCGFETPLTSGWSDITGSVYATKFSISTNLYHCEDCADCVKDDLVESLLKAKYITNDDYKQYQELPDKEKENNE